MAVDTRNERCSAIGVGLPFRLVLPNADGTVNQADRQHVAYLYAGILAAFALEARFNLTEAQDANFQQTAALDAAFNQTEARDATFPG